MREGGRELGREAEGERGKVRCSPFGNQTMSCVHNKVTRQAQTKQPNHTQESCAFIQSYVTFNYRIDTLKRSLSPKLFQVTAEETLTIS